MGIARSENGCDLRLPQTVKICHMYFGQHFAEWQDSGCGNRQVFSLIRTLIRIPPIQSLSLGKFFSKAVLLTSMIVLVSKHIP
jgi:hypothetical protein